MIDICIKTALQFYKVLYSFCAARETRNAIVELKHFQELPNVDQYPLFLVFLDLRKAYNNLDCGWLLQMRSGYRVGPKLRGLLA